MKIYSDEISLQDDSQNWTEKQKKDLLMRRQIEYWKKHVIYGALHVRIGGTNTYHRTHRTDCITTQFVLSLSYSRHNLNILRIIVQYIFTLDLWKAIACPVLGPTSLSAQSRCRTAH